MQSTMREDVTRQELEAALRDAGCSCSLDALLSGPMGAPARIALTNAVLAHRHAKSVPQRFDPRAAAAGDLIDD